MGHVLSHALGLGHLRRDDRIFFTLFYLFIRFLPMISIVEMRSLVHETNEEGQAKLSEDTKSSMLTDLSSQREHVLARLSIYGGVFIVGVLGSALYAIALSPWYTDVRMCTREQPVPFSHKHHAGELGIDCRYCHTSVEKSPSRAFRRRRPA